MKKVLFTILPIVFIAITTIAFGAWQFHLKTAYNGASSSLKVDVKPGMSLNALREELTIKDIVIPEIPFKIWTRLSDAASRLHVGEFEINVSENSASEILEQILSGTPLGYKIVIREGINIWDIQNIFAEEPLNVDPAIFQKWIRAPHRLKRMGVPEPKAEGVEATLEGFLYPETYTFHKYTSPEKIIDKMLELFEENIAPTLAKHPWGNTPEGRHRLITLASIVEKESGNFDEQPTIASVYWNRLNKGMRMQADPTTIYGLMPNFDGNLKKVHLLTPSPYNTYKMKGLPAGPIANPGKSAVQATVDPASTDYLFFVSRNDGTHVFSKDYKTHDKYVNEYQRNRRRRSK
ncbi:endolytic transglycosylase MltG [bacterium]|nr:endolytic transglycosylase MltG [bacterium]